MDIILLSRQRGATHSVSLAPRLLAFAALCLLGAAMTAGMALGAWWTADRPVGADMASAARAVDSIGQEHARRELDALAVHVAGLQARLTRLDALGERLTVLARLDPGEFDFSQPVGQGGPEEPLDGTARSTPLRDTLDRLLVRIESREQQLQALERLLAERRLDEAAQLSGWPVRQGYVSSPFGPRSDPLNGRASVHKGIDFAARAGSEVVAVAAGVVTWAGRRNGYGNLVEISHGDGYLSLYAHNQSNRVKVGDLVRRGQAIAEVGRSGRSTGYHVHFEVSKDGRVVDPAAFIARAEAGQ